MNVWQTTYLEWVKGRLELAKNLASKSGYGVADAGVILGALISALSSDFLERPSSQGDKKRFIQLLVDDRVVGYEQLFRKISLPSLLSKCDANLQNSCIRARVEQCFENSDIPPRMLTSSINASDVDTLSDAEIAQYTSLKLSQIRCHSYASIFYENVRCSYLHEYRSGNIAFLIPDTGESSSNLASYTLKRELGFSLTACEEVIITIAEALSNNARSADKDISVQFEAPKHFWIDV